MSPQQQQHIDNKLRFKFISYLISVSIQLLKFIEKQDPRCFVARYPIVGLLCAASNLITNCQQENINEEVVALCWHITLG